MKNLLARGGIEFLAVLLGITGSLYIDRLTNENEIRDEIKDSFNSLHTELQHNIDNLDMWFSHIEISLNQFELILNKKNYSTFSNDQLDKAFFYTFSNFGEKMRTSVFDAMKSSGLIYKIDDINIKNQILQLYQRSYSRHDWMLDYDETRYLKVYDMVMNEFVFDNKQNSNDYYLNLDWGNKRNLEQLNTNFRYRNHLISNKENKKLYSIVNRQAKEKTEEILVALNSYLK